MQINIITSYDFISYYFFYPLLVYQKELKKFGYKFKFYTKYTPKLCDCDLLLIDSKFFRPLWGNRKNDAYHLLEKFNRKCKRVFWLDTTDSTGATQFQVLPYVDKYLKKQLLKDHTLYLNNYYGARIFTDYYKKTYKLAPEKVFEVQPIVAKYISKLGISWNLGMGQFPILGRFNNLKRYIPYTIKKRINLKYKSILKLPGNNRANTICFRGTDKYNNLSIAFQRIKIKSVLEAMNIKTDPIPVKEYNNEIKSSKIGISPFGAGEICFRDFELIVNGVLLMKPDMSHLETWPDYYKPGVTYIPFKWDFSDFASKLDIISAKYDEFMHIAENAQTLYANFISDKGSDKFCEYFEKMTA